MPEPTIASFGSWAILELMGHVRIAGRVTEEEHFGSKLGRIDIPGPDGAFVTQFFGGGSIYRLTPTTEEIARAAAKHCQSAPVHRWELPAPKDKTGPAEDEVNLAPDLEVREADSLEDY